MPILTAWAQTPVTQADSIASVMGLQRERTTETGHYRVDDPSRLAAFGFAEMVVGDAVSLINLGDDRWRLRHLPSGRGVTLPIADPQALVFDLDEGQTFWTRFSDVAGIGPDTRVMIQGYPVGRVLHIELERVNPGLDGITFKVWLRISEALPLPAASTRIQIEQPLPIQPATLVLVHEANPAGEPVGAIADLGEIPAASPARLSSVVDIARQAGERLLDFGERSAEIPGRLHRLLDELDSAVAAIKSLGLTHDLPARLVRLLDHGERKLNELVDNVALDVKTLSQTSLGVATTLSTIVGDFDPAADLDRLDLSDDNTIAGFVYRFNRASRQLDAFASSDDGINRIAGQLNRLLDTAEKTLATIQAAAGDIRLLTDRDTIATLDRTLASSEAVLQALANDIGGVLDNFSSLTWNLQEITRQLRDSPSSVIWGQPARE